MINKAKLKYVLELQGMSLANLAEHLGISKTTLYRKLSGESDFYREEIIKTCKFCKLDEDSMVDIFFTT